MNAAICTLFEGHYHYGVASLSNSLYNQGFRGIIYVGYRGSLPNWALQGKIETIGKWKDAITLTPIEGIQLCFLLLDTDYSLTNYKPDFMLDIWEGPAKDSEAIFYFDPDIVISRSWGCFEEWVQCGISVCEDILSPLEQFHPRRVGWRKFYLKYQLNLEFKNSIYVNGGFVGVHKNEIEFLKIWKNVQKYMGEIIGGLNISIFSEFSKEKCILWSSNGFNIFDRTDQDALNASIEAYRGDVSFMGKEGMALKVGENLMAHALGGPKPWVKKFISEAINGAPPSIAEKEYWNYTKGIINIYSGNHIARKKMAIKFASFIGRFYKR
jgi:hypothetical protein